MATQSYVDIGPMQRPESGSPTARTSYVDIGAAQRQETGVVIPPTDVFPQSRRWPVQYRRDVFRRRVV